MARSRNIKPGFFKNEKLADAGMAGRLLFAGLWTLADREGRLEDRPRYIKAEIFPYDDVDVVPLLQLLHDKGFILRYAVNGEDYISIVKWDKHQSPHIKEAASLIPPPSEHHTSTVLAPCNTDTSTEVAALIPDSLNLIPDSLNPIVPADADPSFAKSQKKPFNYSEIPNSSKPEKPKREKKTPYSQEQLTTLIEAFAIANNYDPALTFKAKWAYGQAPKFLGCGYTTGQMTGCIAYMRKSNNKWWKAHPMKICDVQEMMPTYMRELADGGENDAGANLRPNSGAVRNSTGVQSGHGNAPESVTRTVPEGFDFERTLEERRRQAREAITT